MTVFGDVISQHGGWIWLGSLIESLSVFGYSERLVRTSVFRLVKEDWLQVKKIGRKSYYGYTDSANNHFIKASRKIYAKSPHSTDECWLILLSSLVDESKMPELKRQLKWLGFSPLASGVFAHPNFDRNSLEETISELELSDSVVIFSSKTIDEASSRVLKKLVFEKWNLKDLQEKYKDFIKIYDLVGSKKNFTDRQSFSIRTLLIHEYRRILLSDHELSSGMLPQGWLGYTANQMVKSFYARLDNASCRYITSSLESMDGFLPKASSGFNQRFKH